MSTHILIVMVSNPDATTLHDENGIVQIWQGPTPVAANRYLNHSDFGANETAGTRAIIPTAIRGLVNGATVTATVRQGARNIVGESRFVGPVLPPSGQRPIPNLRQLPTMSNTNVSNAPVTRWIEIIRKWGVKREVVPIASNPANGTIASGAVAGATGGGTENWNDPRFNIELVSINANNLRVANRVRSNNPTKIVVHHDGSWNVSSRNVTASQFGNWTMAAQGRSAGYHMAVDIYGGIVQYALIEEVVWHTGGDYNRDGIGVAYINERFNESEMSLTDPNRRQIVPRSEQYDSLVWVVAMLAVEFNIAVNSTNILTHSRGGSQATNTPDCPLYFSVGFNDNAVENWQRFLRDVTVTANVIRG